MFQLTEHKAKLSNVNPRAEMHGDQPKPAFDLSIEAACPSSILNAFHADLRQTLYKKDENPDLVEQIEGDGMTALRLPKLGSLKWDQEYSGFTATVDYGMGGDSNIVLADVKVDKFRFEAQEGGTVLVSCRVIAHPDEKHIGPLCNLIQRDIIITITPPPAETVQELFGETPAAAPKKSKKQQTEENLAEVQRALEGAADSSKAPALNPAAAWPFPTGKAA